MKFYNHKHHCYIMGEGSFAGKQCKLPQDEPCDDEPCDDDVIHVEHDDVIQKDGKTIHMSSSHLIGIIMCIAWPFVFRQFCAYSCALQNRVID